MHLRHRRLRQAGLDIQCRKNARLSQTSSAQQAVVPKSTIDAAPNVARAAPSSAAATIAEAMLSAAAVNVSNQPRRARAPQDPRDGDKAAWRGPSVISRG
jgi:hypothetical protein